MSMCENDPRNIAFAALYLAIVWYRELDPEQAWRLIQGKSQMVCERKLTPETLGKIRRHLSNGMSFPGIEKKYKVNRYTVFEELKKQKCN